MPSSKSKNFLSLLCLTLVCLYSIWILTSVFVSDRIPANNGLGWDGVIYTNVAKNFHETVINHQFSHYSAQRIFPSFVVFIIAKLLHVQITESNAPLLFSILNACMLFCCLALWAKLAKKLQWNESIKCISFAGLFLNYVNLKMAFYYSPLTDTTAFAIGFLTLYFYILDSKKSLLLTTVIGAFTFPTLLYSGLIMYLFPLNDGNNNDKQRLVGPITDSKNKLLDIVLACFNSAIITYFCLNTWYYNDRLGAAQAIGGNYSLPILSLSSFALFLYLSAFFFPLMKYLRKIALFDRLTVATFIFLLVKTIITWLVSTEDNSTLTFSEYMMHISGQALAYPLNFIFSHIIYFGPIICLLILLWKDAINFLMKQRALGLFILAFVYALLSLGSESRQLINFLPIAVYMVAETLNHKPASLPLPLAIIFVALSLFISKFWLPINLGAQWPSLLNSDPKVTLEFPMQWYFMSHGPWVSQQMYIINGIVACGSFFIVFMMIRMSRFTSIKEDG